MDEEQQTPPEPEETRAESAYEGRVPPPAEPTDTSEQGIRATGGVPSEGRDAVGPEADPAPEEMAREAGGAPRERKSKDAR